LRGTWRCSTPGRFTEHHSRAAPAPAARARAAAGTPAAPLRATRTGERVRHDRFRHLSSQARAEMRATASLKPAHA
jgi:hypothetical protein